MLELSLRKDDQEVMKYLLVRDVTNIGRAGQNDICLPDPSISRTHLTITRKGEQYIVTDRSTNGTFLNDDRISSAELKAGDVLRLGGWSAVARVAAEADDKPTQVAERDPTRVLSYQPEKRELRVERALLEMVDPPNHLHPVNKGVFSIGKSKSNDLILDDDFVSTFHCRIENRDGRFFVKDLGSTNGTFVNGQQVVETTLPPNSILQVARTKLRFTCAEEVRKIEPSKESQFEGILSKEPAMRQIFTLIDRVAPSDVTVIIQGETGSGKELIARAVHGRSARVKKVFVALNCGAISPDLIESELFGHEKGAFTSAHQQRRGVFEQAHGGTLFLDEIGELPLDLQPKLLRVLETGEIKRVGGSQIIPVNVRVVAATNRDLSEEVRKGRFREDLFFRLYVVPIKLPALRERREDILSLAEHFLKGEFALQRSKGVKKLSPEAVEKLTAYAWPGNIRELKNVISRAVLECRSEMIGPGDLQFAPLGVRELTAHEFDEDTKIRTVTRTLRDVERDKIIAELRKNNWNKKVTAKVLGIAKSTLHEKIKKYGISEE